MKVKFTTSESKRLLEEAVGFRLENNKRKWTVNEAGLISYRTTGLNKEVNTFEIKKDAVKGDLEYFFSHNEFEKYPEVADLLLILAIDNHSPVVFETAEGILFRTSTMQYISNDINEIALTMMFIITSAYDQQITAKIAAGQLDVSVFKYFNGTDKSYFTPRNGGYSVYEGVTDTFNTPQGKMIGIGHGDKIQWLLRK